MNSKPNIQEIVRAQKIVQAAEKMITPQRKYLQALDQENWSYAAKISKVLNVLHDRFMAL